MTGGTGGIGFEVAKAFALANAKVFLLSRHEENADEAVTKIKEASSTADVHFVQCDLGNMATVRSVADKLREQEPRMDIVRPPS